MWSRQTKMHPLLAASRLGGRIHGGGNRMEMRGSQMVMFGGGGLETKPAVIP